MCLTAHDASGDSQGDSAGDRSWERAPPPRTALGRRKLAAARRGAQRRVVTNPFAILGEIEEEPREVWGEEEVEDCHATHRSPCLGAFLEHAFDRAAGEGRPPADPVADPADLRQVELLCPPVRLESVVDFPLLPQIRGLVAPLVAQDQEDGSSASTPVILIGEIPVTLALEPAAALSWAREEESLGFPGEGPGDADASACWAGPSTSGPCWAGSAFSPRAQAEPSDAGHVVQGQMFAVQMGSRSPVREVDGFIPSAEVLKWFWLPVGTLDRELGFPAAKRDIHRHRFRAKQIISVSVSGSTE
jgi:hypothetical protein